ncbi:hypothetical protein J22TS1_43880 [Siminovitchia terrae]|uniref:hypothetical protein n=1 Tax=Siminovitchia terrae TaxID=1914933 RepID=UPI001B21B913|nr:hypothetical protein [Siminovitchia terrae]GIN93337.1 hypothetical protein J22TS1_43880 [Siminovitchia terrae]
MNELEAHKIRKRGEYTPDDVLKEASFVIKEQNVRRMVVIIQTEDNVIHRINTELEDVELAGLLEVAKIYELRG